MGIQFLKCYVLCVFLLLFYYDFPKRISRLLLFFSLFQKSRRVNFKGKKYLLQIEKKNLLSNDNQKTNNLQNVKNDLSYEILKTLLAFLSSNLSMAGHVMGVLATMVVSIVLLMMMMVIENGRIGPRTVRVNLVVPEFGVVEGRLLLL
jgi:hypothetical protein